jgi:hypothetical protein
MKSSIGKIPISAGLAAVGLLVAMGTPTQATELTVIVSGSLGKAENGCNRIVLLLAATGCSYGDDQPGILGWSGPFDAGGYYTPGSAGDDPFYTPAPGDGKITPSLAGWVTVNDGGTPGVGSDDTLAATLVIGPAIRNIWTGNGARTVERWESITHTLAPTAVTAASANAVGGFDYLIAPQGLPALICSQTDPTQCFASEYAPPILTPPGFWGGPEPAGIGIERNASQGGHAGAQTLAVIAGYSCSSNTSGGLGCPDLNGPGSALLWGGLEDPGFDNLLLRVSTDDAGNVVSAFGYWTQEFAISIANAPPGDNSWLGGTLSFGTPAVIPNPAAGWLLASAGVALTRLRRRADRP